MKKCKKNSNELPTMYKLSDFSCEEDIKQFFQQWQELCVAGNFLQRKAVVLGIDLCTIYDFHCPTFEQAEEEIQSEQDAKDCLEYCITVYSTTYEYLQDLQILIGGNGNA